MAIHACRNPRHFYAVAVAICLVCSSILLVSSCAAPRTGATPIPLSNAHAHNDYAHTRPLFDALEHGFTSVEADIHLVEGDLYVAHDADDITPARTLRSLYLDPLRTRIRQNAGLVYPNGPQFTLLIDIKTEADATYRVLSKMLAEYESIFTRFGPEGRADKAVIAVVSGNRPRQLMESEKVRYAGYDGRLKDLESDAPATLIPLISDNWTSHFKWTGNGDMPEQERRKLSKIVESAHKKGRSVRFWATRDNASPARQALWLELLRAEVDLINTDHLEDLKQFLLANTPQ